MIPRFLATDTITVKRATVSEDGRSERDWSNATTRTVANCSLQESASTGGVGDRENATQAAVLYLNPGADVKPADRVTLDGKTWVVTGEIAHKGRGTRIEHLEANLSRWVG